MAEKKNVNIEFEFEDVEISEEDTFDNNNIDFTEDALTELMNRKASIETYRTLIDEVSESVKANTDKTISNYADDYDTAVELNERLKEKLDVGSRGLKFSRAALEKVLQIAENNPEAQLPEICELYRADLLDGNSELKELLKKYKTHYYMTPEQILIADQRYYAEEQLKLQEKEMKERNEILQEEAERREREMARHNRVLEEEAEMSRREAEKARQDAEKARQDAEFRSEMERLRQQSERRSQEERERLDKFSAMNNCRHCAKRYRCFNQGVVGCGAFVPR